MSRRVIEGRQHQGVDERVAYSIDTSTWGGSPTSPSVTVRTINLDDTFTDVTATVMPTNSPSVAGDVITLSLLRNLTAGVRYRVEVQFTSGGNLYEPFFVVLGEA
jgi:hypothetical protein